MRVPRSAARTPDAIAWDFLDTRCSYRELLADIERCADALAALGLARGQSLLIAMPTTPQGVIAFYAANRLGAVPALIHPLSTTAEIEHYLDASGAELALALDAFYPQMAAARPRQPLRHIVVARIGDRLPILKRLGFWLAKGRRIRAIPRDPRVHTWRQLMQVRHPAAPPAAGGVDVAGEERPPPRRHRRRPFRSLRRGSRA